MHHDWLSYSRTGNVMHASHLQIFCLLAFLKENIPLPPLTPYLHLQPVFSAQTANNDFPNWKIVVYCFLFSPAKQESLYRPMSRGSYSPASIQDAQPCESSDSHNLWVSAHLILFTAGIGARSTRETRQKVPTQAIHSA